MVKRYHKRVLIAAAAVLAVFLGFSVFGAADSGDPLISLSYLTEIFIKPRDSSITNKAKLLYDQSITAFDQNAQKKLDNIGQSGLSAQLFDRVYAKVAQKLKANPALLSSRARTVSLKLGDRITGAPGSGLVLESGSAKSFGPVGSELVSVTSGSTLAPGSDIMKNSYYMILASNGSGLVVTSGTAVVKLLDGASVVSAASAEYKAQADALNILGLFKGSTIGYELERTPTRQEAMIMLIRLLGEEQAALAFTGTSPFTDHTWWPEGQRYVNYGFDRGYTKGVSQTAFAPLTNASMEMYLTYVLRSLGYSEEAGDFVYGSTTFSFSIQLGLLNQAQYDSITKGYFLRDHLVLISYNALFTKLKGQSTTLSDRLIAQGVITQALLDQATSTVK